MTQKLLSRPPYPGIRRVIAGLVLALLSGAVCSFLLLMLGSVSTSSAQISWGGLSFLYDVAVRSLTRGAIVTLLCGVPLYLLFHYLQWNRLGHWVTWGALLGVFSVPQFWFSLTHWALPDRYYVFFSLIGILSGAVGGAVFWLVAYWGRTPAKNRPMLADGTEEFVMPSASDTSATQD